MYGSTVNPSSTSVSAASSSSTGSGSSVRSSAMTSSLTISVPSASRARRAVRTASPAVKQPAVFGSTRMPSRSSTDSTDPCTEGGHPPHRDGAWPYRSATSTRVRAPS
ncbi:hypothetical protein SGRIM128S_02022 [Streptomyces griseomycini]